jgi:hypothetical protein
MSRPDIDACYVELRRKGDRYSFTIKSIPRYENQELTGHDFGVKVYGYETMVDCFVSKTLEDALHAGNNAVDFHEGRSK